jgi:hypothetical protein
MRHELAIFIALLLCVPCLHAQEYDPAYVDSPANRVRPDPARADAGGGNAGARAPEYASARHTSAEDQAAAEAAQQEMLAQIERMTAAQVEAAYRGQQQGLAAANQDQQHGLYPDPPIGGRSMIDDVRRDPDHGYGSATQPIMLAPPGPVAAGPQASARQQLGSALLQDAGGVIDARTQRELYGNAGPVYLPGEAPGR